MCRDTTRRWGGHSGDGYDMSSTLRKDDVRKGDLFVGQGCDQ